MNLEHGPVLGTTGWRQVCAWFFEATQPALLLLVRLCTSRLPPWSSAPCMLAVLVPGIVTCLVVFRLSAFLFVAQFSHI